MYMVIQTVTWDAVNKSAGVTLSNGNLTAVIPSQTNTVRASLGRTTGKWYWEVKFDSLSNAMTGVVNSSASFTTANYNTTSVRYYYNFEKKYPGGAIYGTSYVAGDVISVLLDLDVGIIEFWKNGASHGVAFTDVSTMGEVFPAVTSGSSSLGNTNTARFNVDSFSYKMPEGYLAYDGSKYSVNKFLILSSSGEVESVQGIKISTSTAIPTMTSNVLPSGVASASTQFDATYNPYNAFNNLGVNDGWITASAVLTGWLSYEFPTPVRLCRYSLLPRQATLTASPKNWTFEGWDGIQWIVLDTRTNQSGWVDAVYREYTFANVKSYKKYRINITANDGYGSYIAISELRMFSLLEEEMMKSIPSQTEQDFIAYGLDSIASIDPTTDYTKKQYINNQSVVLGVGKTIEHSIDMNKYKVNKITFQ